MELRTMQYYLAVVREGTISAAAQSLHIAQPSLSRSMKELEEELGTALFVRGNRRITLTEEGMIFRKRAEEMIRLMRLTEEEISHAERNIYGSVRIGAGESLSFHYLSRAAASLAKEHPDIHFHIISGDTEDLMDELNNGLIDFAVIFTDVDHTIYQAIELPLEDHFVLLMPKDCPLSDKKEIHISDLTGLPVIVSRAAVPYFSGSEELSALNVAATYNLIYNASLLVEDGLGYAICFDGLINTTGDSPLCVRPIATQIKAAGTLIWKKYQVFSPAVQMFIDRIRDTVNQSLQQ
ncbi:MAG: LysR family transcriptional regulator [Solobacterium sp.]|nr:LysR family transcriptional regulator [Solobacterium sp.]